MGITQDLDSIFHDLSSNFNELCGVDICVSGVLVVLIVGLLFIWRRKRG